MELEPIEVSIKCFPHHDGLELPRYLSDGSSGMDLEAALEEEVVLLPGDRALIPTGIAITSEIIIARSVSSIVTGNRSTIACNCANRSSKLGNLVI